VEAEAEDRDVGGRGWVSSNPFDIARIAFISVGVVVTPVFGSNFDLLGLLGDVKCD
jgi:hypothetical protein